MIGIENLDAEASISSEFNELKDEPDELEEICSYTLTTLVQPLDSIHPGDQPNLSLARVYEVKTPDKVECKIEKDQTNNINIKMGKKRNLNDPEEQSKRKRTVSSGSGPEKIKRRRKSSGKSFVISSNPSTEEECVKCRRKFHSAAYKRHMGTPHDINCTHIGCDYAFDETRYLNSHNKEFHSYGKIGNYAFFLERVDPMVPKIAKTHIQTVPVLNEPEDRSVSPNQLPVQPQFQGRTDENFAPVTPANLKIKKTSRKKSPERKKKSKLSNDNIEQDVLTPNAAEEQESSPTVIPGENKKQRKRRERLLNESASQQYYECDKCLQYFSNNSSFTNHTKLDHKYYCMAHCERSFVTTSLKNNHVKTQHPEIKGSQVKQCPECKEWIDNKSFASHQKTQHTHQCTECCFKFSNSHQLFQHKVNTHIKNQNSANLVVIPLGAKKLVETVDPNLIQESILETESKRKVKPSKTEQRLKSKKEKKSIKKNLKEANTTKSSEATSVQPTQLETSNLEPTLASKSTTDSDLGDTQKTTEPSFLGDLKPKKKKKSRKEKCSTKSSEPTLSFLNTVITTETGLNSLPSDRVIKNTSNNSISISNPEKKKFDSLNTRESSLISETIIGKSFQITESNERESFETKKIVIHSLFEPASIAKDFPELSSTDKKESPRVSEPKTGARFLSLASGDSKTKESSHCEEPKTTEIFMSEQTEMKVSPFPSAQQEPRENPESAELELKERPLSSEQRVRESSSSLREFSIYAEQEPREISPSVEQETRESSLSVEQKPRESSSSVKQKLRERSPSTKQEPRENYPFAEQESRESSLSAEQESRESSLYAEQETREGSLSVDQEPRESSPLAEQEQRGITPSAEQDPRENSLLAEQKSRESFPLAKQKPRESFPLAKRKPRESSLLAKQKTRRSTPSAEQELRVRSPSEKKELRESSHSAKQEAIESSPSAAPETRENFKSNEHKVRETHLAEASEVSESDCSEIEDFSKCVPVTEAGSIEMEENSQLNICDDNKRPEDTNEYKEDVGVSPKDDADIVLGQVKPGVVSEAIPGDGSSREETVQEVNNTCQVFHESCLLENDIQQSSDSGSLDIKLAAGSNKKLETKMSLVPYSIDSESEEDISQHSLDSSVSSYQSSQDLENIDLGQPLASSETVSDLPGAKSNLVANSSPNSIINESELSSGRSLLKRSVKQVPEKKPGSWKEVKGAKILQAKNRKNQISSPSIYDNNIAQNNLLFKEQESTEINVGCSVKQNSFEKHDELILIQNRGLELSCSGSEISREFDGSQTLEQSIKPEPSLIQPDALEQNVAVPKVVSKKLEQVCLSQDQNESVVQKQHFLEERSSVGFQTEQLTHPEGQSKSVSEHSKSVKTELQKTEIETNSSESAEKLAESDIDQAKTVTQQNSSDVYDFDCASAKQTKSDQAHSVSSLHSVVSTHYAVAEQIRMDDKLSSQSQTYLLQSQSQVVHSESFVEQSEQRDTPSLELSAYCDDKPSRQLDKTDNEMKVSTEIVASVQKPVKRVGRPRKPGGRSKILDSRLENPASFFLNKSDLLLEQTVPPKDENTPAEQLKVTVDNIAYNVNQIKSAQEQNSSLNQSNPDLRHDMLEVKIKSDGVRIKFETKKKSTIPMPQTNHDSADNVENVTLETSNTETRKILFQENVSPGLSALFQKKEHMEGGAAILDTELSHEVCDFNINDANLSERDQFLSQNPQSQGQLGLFYSEFNSKGGDKWFQKVSFQPVLSNMRTGTQGRKINQFSERMDNSSRTSRSYIECRETSNQRYPSRQLASGNIVSEMRLNSQANVDQASNASFDFSVHQPNLYTYTGGNEHQSIMVNKPASSNLIQETSADKRKSRWSKDERKEIQLEVQVTSQQEKQELKPGFFQEKFPSLNSNELRIQPIDRKIRNLRERRPPNHLHDFHLYNTPLVHRGSHLVPAVPLKPSRSSTRSKSCLPRTSNVSVEGIIKTLATGLTSLTPKPSSSNLISDLSLTSKFNASSNPLNVTNTSEKSSVSTSTPFSYTTSKSHASNFSTPFPTSTHNLTFQTSDISTSSAQTSITPTKSKPTSVIVSNSYSILRVPIPVPSTEIDVNEDLAAKLQLLENHVKIHEDEMKQSTEDTTGDVGETMEAIERMVKETTPNRPISSSESGIWSESASLNYDHDQPETVTVDDWSDDDDDELGKYSPGDSPGEVDEVEENIENISSFISNRVRLEDENDDYLSDVDDLLGSSDEEERKAETAKSPLKPRTSPMDEKKKRGRKKHLACPLCNLKMKPDEYNVHVKQDHTKQCKFCHLKFTYEHGLEDHVAKDHQEENSLQNEFFSCKYCQINFNRKGPYTKHMRDSHAYVDGNPTKPKPVKPIRASKAANPNKQAGQDMKKSKESSSLSVKIAQPLDNMCDSPKKKTFNKKFTIPKVLTRKVKTPENADQGNFGLETCELCETNLIDFEEFAAHINALHSFPCPEEDCGKSFTGEYMLRVHLHQKHGATAPNPAEEPAQEKFKKLFNKRETSLDDDTYDISFLDQSNLSEISILDSSEHKCYECNQVFSDADSLTLHANSHFLNSRPFTPTNEETQPSGSSVNHLSEKNERTMIECHCCKKRVENSRIVQHLKMCEKEQSKRGEGCANFCLLCRSVYTNTVEFLKHKEIKHAFKCNQCMLSFITQELTNAHILEAHNVFAYPDLEETLCSLCGTLAVNHESVAHNFTCSQPNCDKRFTSDPELTRHLKAEHNHFSVIKVPSSNNTIRITSVRSKLNEEISTIAEQWIKDRSAISRMKEIMKSSFKSRRHDLFLVRKEREQCNGMKMSTLHRLSNPSFLGGNFEQDSTIINLITQTVFKPTLESSDPNLKNLGPEVGFSYSSLVLFPETFIHKYETMGMSRHEAEQQYLEVHIDKEEWEGLNREIENAVGNRDSENTSEDEWVDHSDISDVDE